jgi:hypothetical protein
MSPALILNKNAGPPHDRAHLIAGIIAARHVDRLSGSIGLRRLTVALINLVV